MPEWTSALGASEWYYIWAAYGMTWAVLGGYGTYLVRRRVKALARFDEARTSEGGMP